jgi:catechol 2,3-dioxygenase-like lactoylglutathione lyase family enzyme
VGPRLEKTVIECSEPRVLATFYARLLDMQMITDEPDWVVIGREPGMRELAFQRPEHPGSPEPWPGGPPRLHLDIHVDDVEETERLVLALGASRALGAPETGYRVFRDPEGHPFCLVHHRASANDPRFRNG